jgi:hypothetical protein
MAITQAARRRRTRIMRAVNGPMRAALSLPQSAGGRPAMVTGLRGGWPVPALVTCTPQSSVASRAPDPG